MTDPTLSQIGSELVSVIAEAHTRMEEKLRRQLVVTAAPENSVLDYNFFSFIDEATLTQNFHVSFKLNGEPFDIQIYFTRKEMDDQGGRVKELVAQRITREIMKKL